VQAPFEVFLLGTPGCGKSEIYRRLAGRIRDEGLAEDVLRIDDYPKVHGCFAADDEAETSGRSRQWSARGGDGGWVITNPSLCWERNRRRRQAAVAAGTDDHLVSREEMEKTYLRDDHDRLHTLSVPFLLIDNHMDGSALLDYATQGIVAVLKAN
jgi:hypothetical protein